MLTIRSLQVTLMRRSHEITAFIQGSITLAKLSENILYPEARQKCGQKLFWNFQETKNKRAVNSYQIACLYYFFNDCYGGSTEFFYRK